MGQVEERVDEKRLESRMRAGEARIDGINDPNMSYRQSVQEWESELNKKKKWEKSIMMYIIIIMTIIFIFYVVMKYAFLMF